MEKGKEGDLFLVSGLEKQPSLEDVSFPGAGSLYPLAVLLSVVTQSFHNPPNSSCN